MKKEIKQQNLALSVSLIFLLLVAAGFFWLWQLSQPSSTENVALDSGYAPVEIASVKARAQELISSKANLVGMPIAAPVSNVGRENPFAGI